MRQYPKLVPFEQRRVDFHCLKQRVQERFNGKLDLWISDVRYDRYGLYHLDSMKAVVLISGAGLADFDLSRVSV